MGLVIVPHVWSMDPFAVSHVLACHHRVQVKLRQVADVGGGVEADELGKKSNEELLDILRKFAQFGACASVSLFSLCRCGLTACICCCCR